MPLNKLEVVAFFAFWLLAMVHVVRSIFFRKSVQLPEPVDVDSVIKEFSRRRHVFLRSMAIALCGFGYLILLPSLGRPGGTILGLSYASHVVIAFVIIGIGIAIASFVYRCPACGSPPWTSMGGGQMGVDLSPVACPTCGTPLR